MIATQMYLKEEQHKKLREIYAETKQPITETVRQALDFYFKHLEKKEGKK
jgi:DNA-binding protein Fis